MEKKSEWINQEVSESWDVGEENWDNKMQLRIVASQAQQHRGSEGW